MTRIHKQVLTDSDGKPVSVVIPYDQWLQIEGRLGDLEVGASASELEVFAGCISLREDPLDYQRRERKQWSERGA